MNRTETVVTGTVGLISVIGAFLFGKSRGRATATNEFDSGDTTTSETTTEGTEAAQTA